VSRFLVRILVVWSDRFEEVFDDLPENQGRGVVSECDSPAVLHIHGCVLEMCPSEIGMALVLVPPSAKARIRVSVVDAEPIVGVLAVPFDGQFRRLRSCRRVETNRIENRP